MTRRALQAAGGARDRTPLLIAAGVAALLFIGGGIFGITRVLSSTASPPPRVTTQQAPGILPTPSQTPPTLTPPEGDPFPPASTPPDGTPPETPPEPTPPEATPPVTPPVTPPPGTPPEGTPPAPAPPPDGEEDAPVPTPDMLRGGLPFTLANAQATVGGTLATVRARTGGFGLVIGLNRAVTAHTTLYLFFDADQDRAPEFALTLDGAGTPRLFAAKGRGWAPVQAPRGLRARATARDGGATWSVRLPYDVLHVNAGATLQVEPRLLDGPRTVLMMPPNEQRPGTLTVTVP